MRITVIIAMIEPGRWRSRCPSLPGCGAMGQSEQEALRSIDLAIRGYLASLDVPFPLELDLSILPV
jgi:predicted RNase H-like HicB family nuclease